MRALVTYASKRGSTAEIAEAIAETFREGEIETECLPVDQVKTLDPYDLVVIGSAVYTGRWRGDAKRFLRRHREELARKRFWVFSSGPVGDPDTPVSPRWLEPPKIIALAEQLGAQGHVVFGGRVPAQPRGALEQSMVRNTPEQFRDRRDWNEIRHWAERITAECKIPA